ncbi:GNAT family N-acetyltransferase [Phytohabitans rumicis]|uniref:GNAT family N-acetyltransferase n=1 Tax=Phytohabitans rumicis TaxID=1076125 RepID=UPI001FEB4C00|nr:GNAT family N-acetyltransferase [Phytohabitans rumicis]
MHQLRGETQPFLPLQAYAFEASPADGQPFRDYLPFHEGNRTLVVEDGGTALAAVTGIPMRQNVRGTLHRMAGIAGVAVHPLARRQGYVRTLLTQLLREMRDEGHTVSALYPFRASFYERFGYVGLPQRRTVTFAPEDLGHLLRADLPGELAWERIGTGYDTYRAFTQRLAAERHGFATFPDFRAARLREDDKHWLVTARVDGQVAAAALYQITGFGADLVVDHLLVTTPLSRALLLQFFARHVDQVARIVAGVPADEIPELWATDLGTHTEARTRVPNSNAPMARVLSVDALAGSGPGRVVVEVVDDPFIAGTYLLDGPTVTPSDGVPDATLRAAGLSALVYGVLDPDELPLRGFGTVSPDAGAQLRALFPRQVPYLFADF